MPKFQIKTRFEILKLNNYLKKTLLIKIWRIPIVNLHYRQRKLEQDLNCDTEVAFYLTNVVRSEQRLQFSALTWRFCHINISALKHLRKHTEATQKQSYYPKTKLEAESIEITCRKARCHFCTFNTHLFLTLGLTNLYPFFFAPSSHFCGI